MKKLETEDHANNIINVGACGYRIRTLMEEPDDYRARTLIDRTTEHCITLNLAIQIRQEIERIAEERGDPDDKTGYSVFKLKIPYSEECCGNCMLACENLGQEVCFITLFPLGAERNRGWWCKFMFGEPTERRQQ